MTKKSENNFQQSIQEIIILYKNNLVKEANLKSEKLLEDNQNSFFLLNLNGIINITLKNWEKAINSLNKALKKKPDYVEAYNNLGIVYNNLGETKKTIENFTKATALKKDYANGYNGLGSVYNDLGKWEKAILNYCDAIRYDTKHFEAKKNLINILSYYKPTSEIDNLIVQADKKLQKNIFHFKLSNKINNLDLSNFFKVCEDAIKNIINETIYNETQIYRRNTLDLNCKRHFKVFNRFNIIPEYCFGCYKVQVEPRNVVELFKLFFIFDNLKLPNNNIRKCMTEIRPQVKGAYKGLIYCSSLDEANQTMNIITPILKKQISSNISITIRRGCSEFGIAHPTFKEIDKKPNEFMKYNKEWKNKENIIDEELSLENQKKNKVVKDTLLGVSISDALIMNNWLNYASNIGDKSFKKISENFYHSDFLKKLISSQLKNRSI